MTQPSPLYRLIEQQLETPLADLIAARRPAMSWRDIAAEIKGRTDIEVSAEALRLWFVDRITVEVTVS